MSPDHEFRFIPPVNSVLSHQTIKDCEAPRGAILEAARAELAEIRASLSSGVKCDKSLDSIAERVATRAYRMCSSSPSYVVNATGVVLHTNLGRAPLCSAAISALSSAYGYCDLEFDRETGERGSRQSHVGRLLARVTGAEAGMAVNNNAGAVLLTLTALARGKEVIVSRGELVEIGGSFRVPDIMKQSGCTLVEVGTTNRTRLSDYEGAITENTAIILKVHTSNYRMIGFTESVSPRDLAALAEKRGLIMFHDAGSGLMVDLEAYGLTGEPPVTSIVEDGCHLVAYSGDKLFGGPQAGMLVGKEALIKRLMEHPLTRALRLDKVTLSALSATLSVYAYGDPIREIPVLRMLTEPSPALYERASMIALRLTAENARVEVSVLEGESYPGGGSYPGVSIKSPVVSAVVSGLSANHLSELMRRHDPPIIARIEGGRVVIDPRTLSPDDTDVLYTFFRSL